MKVAVISPHLDDAVFSVAEHMLSRGELLVTFTHRRAS